jgi:hypothetical protein
MRWRRIARERDRCSTCRCVLAPAHGAENESGMLRRILIGLAAAAAVCAFASPALASDVSLSFDGGTQAEQGQVRAGLDASSFNWGMIPGPIVVHIRRGVDSHAVPDEVWFDANLLDAGRYSWGVVQHEFAHELDYTVLTDAMRAQLHTLLGGESWWSTDAEAHCQADSERFADLVSWAYWTTRDNVLRPAGAADEGGQVSPAQFRAALAALLPQAQLEVVRVTAGVHRAGTGR